MVQERAADGVPRERVHGEHEVVPPLPPLPAATLLALRPLRQLRPQVRPPLPLGRQLHRRGARSCLSLLCLPNTWVSFTEQRKSTSPGLLHNLPILCPVCLRDTLSLHGWLSDHVMCLAHASHEVHPAASTVRHMAAFSRSKACYAHAVCPSAE